MVYQYNQKELYDRALFTLIKGDQTITVVFEPNGEKSYLMIIFCDDGDIVNPHDQGFQDTLAEIMLKFDAGQLLDFIIFTF